jgi:hypothetical protein
MDARALNWRYVVPGEPAGLLLLPIDDERVEGAVIPPNDPAAVREAMQRGPYPAIAAPDLSRWAHADPSGIRELLRSLAAAVVPGGWLYVGFPNADSPTRRPRNGGFTLRGARRVLRRAGIQQIETYLPFPDQRCPAYLVSAQGSAGLEYFLRHLAFPFTSGEGNHRELRRRLLRVARRAALLAPHRVRVRLAPAVALVARRSA